MSPATPTAGAAAPPPAGPTATAPTPDFAAVRAEFALPAAFPPDVLAQAQAAAAAGPPPDRDDATDIELVTIDPPGSMDLDQAVGVSATAGGFRVHYAIADLAAVVVPGGALDAEVRRRGETVYLPDGSVPLHPPVLSEGASSLLPDRVRAAALWTIDLDATGRPTAVDVRRALVRSRARLDYAGVQADLAAGRLHPALGALPAVGRLRRELALARGAIELEMPEQEVVPDGAGGWRVQLRARLDVEAWNAEISLLTGTCAATLMLGAGVGLLRTLPEPDAGALAGFHRTATHLGIPWPAGAPDDVQTAARVLAGLPPDAAPALALRRSAALLLRGAGYTAFDGTPPAHTAHGGVAAPYAHVTAPLRRLVDRFGTEVCLSVTAGVELPPWLRAALPTLPSIMGTADALANKVDRACVDRTEAAVLAPHLGETFDGVVLKASSDTHAGEVYVHEPPVLAAATGVPEAGARVRVRLEAAEPVTGTVRFAGRG